jgi:hypothetical protein
MDFLDTDDRRAIFHTVVEYGFRMCGSDFLETAWRVEETR